MLAMVTCNFYAVLAAVLVSVLKRLNRYLKAVRGCKALL